MEDKHEECNCERVTEIHRERETARDRGRARGRERQRHRSIEADRLCEKTDIAMMCMSQMETHDVRDTQQYRQTILKKS